MTRKKTVAKLLAILSLGLLGFVPATLLFCNVGTAATCFVAFIVVGFAATLIDPKV